MAEIARIGVLASGDRKSGGGGSTAERFIKDVLQEKVALSVGVVVCNNPEGTVGVYDKVEALNKQFGLKGDERIDVVNISGATHPDGPQERGQTAEESSAICRLFEQRDVSFAAMLGYMKVITTEFVETWAWKPQYGNVPGFEYRGGMYHPLARTSNNHNGILPFTAGKHGEGTHQYALDLFAQDKLTDTAMTWHLASAEVDKGPIIREEPVQILADDDVDSLGGRVQGIEKDLTSTVLETHIALQQAHILAVVHGGLK